MPDQTLITVMAGATLTGALAGGTGCFTVLRRQSLAGDIVSHAALSGIVLSFLAGYQLFEIEQPGGWNLLGGLLTGLLAMGLVQRIPRRTPLQADSALGVALALFFGAGMVLLGIAMRLPSGAARGLEAYLFGMAATLLPEDVYALLGVSALTVGLLAAFWRPLRLVTFDPAYAHNAGFSIKRYDALLTGIMVLVILVGARTVGVVLMVALLTAPAAAARLWTRRLGAMVLLATLFGGLAGAIGAWLSSLATHTPTGPLIVLASAAIFVASLLLAPGRGLIARAFHQRKLRKRWKI